jgi:hypothetical protein
MMKARLLEIASARSETINRRLHFQLLAILWKWKALSQHPPRSLVAGTEAVLSRAPTMIQEIGFALDSPLEGTGFELSVPPRRRGRSEARHMGFARLHVREKATIDHLVQDV